MKMQNATALVTGANRGIGREMVKALLAAGSAKVYATARDRRSLDAIVELDPTRIIPLQIDITDRDLVNILPEKAPDVNLLINNADVLSFGNILDIPFETITQQFETNFYGTLNMARAFVPTIARAEALQRYVEGTLPLLEQAGAKVQRYQGIEALVGQDLFDLVAVMQFPNEAAMRQFLGSDDYAAMEPYRDKAFRFLRTFSCSTVL